MSISDRAAVQAVINTYADRLRAGDVSEVVDLFTERAALMKPDQPTAVGKEQLAAAYQAALDAVDADETFEFDEILVQGDLAVARTRSTGVLTKRHAGDTESVTYRELFVLQRAENGWKIAQYMFQRVAKQ
jgi:uncharacterized protein (TIGR02246 family)